MAQRLSASAKSPAGPGAPPEGTATDAAASDPRPDAPTEARRRAAAYLDLWERQLVHAAARGVPATRRPKRP